MRLPKTIEKPQGKCAVFTICSNNYLAFATTLLQSLATFEPEIDRFLILADQMIAPAHLYPDNASIVAVEELAIPDFLNFAFRYDVMEFNTAIKPWAALHLLEKMGYGSVIYLDPDIEVFAPLVEVRSALQGGASVVLTPHICNPAEGEVIPNDLQFLQAGTYNLGFCAWGKSEEALSTLRWWARRLEHQCVNEVARGLFVDQKFIDLVPGFVDRAVILRSPNLNVAYWNLSQRDLQGAGDNWTVDGMPLGFFHFSGFQPTRLDILSKHTPMFQGRNISPNLRQLLQAYANKLFENGYGAVPAGAYAWGHLSSGTRIHPSIRKMFRERFENWQGDPFTSFESALTARPAHADVASQSADKNDTSPLSAHMLYLRDGLNWLQFMFDPDTLQGAAGLAQWYMTTDSSEWDLDARLLAPTISQLSQKLPTTLAPSTESGRSDVSLIGYLKATSGVGEIARRSLRTLTTLPFSVTGKDIALKVGGARDDESFQAIETEKVSGRVQIFNINADQIAAVMDHIKDERWEDGYKIAAPFWELDKFPKNFAPDLECFDELWASSRHIQALLYRQFPGKPILYMPPDLTPALPSNRDRASFGLADHEFVVFFAFDFLSQLERKNPKGAYEAFEKAFGGNPKSSARFVLKTLNSQYAPPHYAQWHEEMRANPNVTLLEDILSPPDMLALIKCADVVISLHRGEGLGLLIADAIGQNVPVVCTDWSGSTDLIGPSTGYPVHYKLVPTPVSDYPYVDGHQWAAPDVGHAAWQLDQIFRYPDVARAKARRARAHLAVHFGSGRASGEMGARLSLVLNQ